jgi:uncharacterized protein (DUF433 family)
MLLLDRIIINLEIMLGKPAIRGTRLTVELLLRKMSEGATAADLLQMYPQLEAADIEASLRYAAAKATE